MLGREHYTHMSMIFQSIVAVLTVLMLLIFWIFDEKTLKK